MSTDDEIERLLREVEGLDKPPPSASRAPAPSQSKATGKGTSQQVVPQSGESDASPRTAWALKMAVLGAILGFLVGFLPFLTVVSGAIGGAVGGAVAGYISGPRNSSKGH